jgi:hypothetical protein
MPYNYSQYVTELANLLVVPPDDPNFLTVLPNIIDDAEQRIYRELDLLSTIIRDTTGSLTANSRNFTFPQHMIVLESLNVFTPVNSTFNRYPLVATSREWMDWVWGNEAAPSSPSIPNHYAMITDQEIIVGPPPDANYTMEVVGTIRPAPLSSTNSTTYLTEYLPDLFLAASMVFGAGYQMNFSSMSDNPAQSMSWEAHYQALFKSANTEEMRKRYASQVWSPKQPTPLATPPRA